MTLAASGLPMQAAVAPVPQHPDAVRLMGGVIPSGLPLNAPAHVFCGDHWRQGIITATGTTWVEFSMQRHGTTTAYDRRNILLDHEWASYEAACRKWKRDQKKRQQQQQGAAA